MCELRLKFFSSNIIVTVQTHTYTSNTHSAPRKKQKEKKKNHRPLHLCEPILADCSPNHHQGEWQAFQSAPFSSRGPRDFCFWLEEMCEGEVEGEEKWGGERGGEEGACPNRGAGITRTCAGDCRGTGRR